MATAALNPEPSDPSEREANGLTPKSYATAAELPFEAQKNALNAIYEDGTAIDRAAEVALAPNGDPAIDEDAIKESPPRSSHSRNRSSPRPLAEVMDEGEGPGPGSPSLRHPRGRLEDQTPSQETYAGIVRKTPSPLDIRANGANGGAVSLNGQMTPESFDGVGMDDAPRSPVRHAHRRLSSKDLKEKREAQTPQTTPAALASSDNDSGSTGVNGNDVGALVYENLRNKSGDNLASVRPPPSFAAGAKHRVNKASRGGRKRSGSDLVSGRRAGAGWSRSAIRWAPLNVPLQRRLQTLLVLLHTLSIAGGLALFFLLCTVPILWPIMVPYLLYVLLSRASISGELSQRSEWCRRSSIWSLFAGYFPARLHRSQVLEPGRKYIFGYHPHGIISHGAFAAFATEALGFSTLFPGITNTLLTLDANFRIPLYRDYALRMGLASVSRESCENILNKGGPNGEGMGRAITIVIGGARESLDAKPDTLRLVLRRRKGFIKLAMRTGADLVPVLAFGENDLYDQFDAKAHPYVHKAQLLIKKFMGFTVPLFHARGVFNYDVGLMPYRRPINIVVGRPIAVVQARRPDPADVDALHERYVEELVRIWDEWKDTFSPRMIERGVGLEIVE